MDKETELIFSALDKDVVQLFYRWKIYNQLFGSGKENVDLLNKSGSNVFHLFQIMIIDNVFLTLSRLTDPSRQGKNENTSLCNLVERIENTVAGANNLNLTARLSELRTVCKNITTHRMKRLAHSDINHARNAGAEWLPAITYGEIEDALKLVRELMRDIMLLLYDADAHYDPDIPYGRDGNRLLSLLRKMHKSHLSDSGTKAIP